MPRDLEPHLQRATTALRVRQRLSGAWEFYGPRADLDSVLTDGLHARRSLVRAQAALVFETLLGAEPGSRDHYRLKKKVYALQQESPDAPLRQIVEAILEGEPCQTTN